MTALDQAINAHYTRPGLADLIVDALLSDGKDLEALKPDDLAPLDQFHIRGKPATRDLARLAGLAAGMDVLDVGGGLGGPARLVASVFGCRVTVLDATAEYCRIGALLTTMTRQEDRVSFHRADALDIPFADSSFDVAWMQHVSANIGDKPGLFSEIRRVLRPGGRLALYEALAGENGPPYLPVPWASEPATSLLEPPASMRALISSAGFAELAWNDETDRAREWFARPRPSGDKRSALGQHLLFGPVFGDMVRNVVRNLAEKRICIVMAVFARTENSPSAPARSTPSGARS